MNRHNQKTFIFIIALIGILLGMLISTISFYNGYKAGNLNFAMAESKIKDDPNVQKAIEVQQAFRLVAKLLTPSVVNISTETVVKHNFNYKNDPFFEFFGEDWFNHFFSGPQNRDSV